MNPVALLFLILAVAMVPGWLLTGCTQNGIWILGICFAVTSIFAQLIGRAPSIPDNHPDSLGSLDRAERTHRKDSAVTGISSIEDLTRRPALPEVSPTVAEGLCDDHLDQWIRDFAMEKSVLSIVVAHRVAADDQRPVVKVVATEAVRVSEALGVLELERTARRHQAMSDGLVTL